MDSDATATDSAPDITTTPAPQDPAVYQNDDPAYQVFVDTLSYLEPAEIAQIIEAYRFSEAAHQGQQRLSGEPYVTHPLAVAGSLAEWRMDATAIVAALLHDVMEDTAVGKLEIAERFGREVADLVDGCQAEQEGVAGALCGGDVFVQAHEARSAAR